MRLGSWRGVLATGGSAALIAAGLLVTAGTATAATTVSVPGTAGPASLGGTGIVDTGISVTSAVTLTATGTINISTNLSFGQNITPDGDPAKVACTASCFVSGPTQWSLIAKIGTGAWQEVGSGPTKLTGSGTLYLAVDDTGYSDNSGTWSVDVSLSSSPVAVASSGSVGVYLCYSTFGTDTSPAVFPVASAKSLITSGYFAYWSSAVAEPGNVTDGDNIGSYHLVCNPPSDFADTGLAIADGGETYANSGAVFQSAWNTTLGLYEIYSK